MKYINDKIARRYGRGLYPLVLPIFLAGCAVGEDYKIPEYAIYPTWKEWATSAEQSNKITPEEAVAHQGPWWELFNDSTLTWLINQALANNNDLQQAQARILEARANERLADSAFFPQINGSGTENRSTLGSTLGNKLDTTRTAQVNGTLGLDLFGGDRRQSEAAEYETEQTEAQKANTRRVLISDVARNYVRLRSLQKQAELTQKNLDLQLNTLKITEAQRERKIVSDLDLMRAQAQVDTTSAAYPQIIAQESETISRLFVLINDKQGILRDKLKDIQPIPNLPEPAVTMQPAEVIRNRPDVRAAERALARATALTGAAFADFFPKLSLQGFLGASHSQVYGGLQPWNAVANATMPLLSFGKIQSGLDSANARQQQAFYSFQQSILLAIEDVEVRMSAYRTELERREHLIKAAGEQAKAAMIAREQYLAGILPQLDLIDAQRNALNAENDLAASEGQLSQNLVLLYAALGESDKTEKTQGAVVGAATPVASHEGVVPSIQAEEFVAVSGAPMSMVEASPVLVSPEITATKLPAPSAPDAVDAVAPVAAKTSLSSPALLY